MKKQFLGNCVNNPFNSAEALVQVIDNARDITQRTFLHNCEVNPELKKDIMDFPYDYSFSKYRNIYFFTWSAIEYFYI